MATTGLGPLAAVDLADRAAYTGHVKRRAVLRWVKVPRRGDEVRHTGTHTPSRVHAWRTTKVDAFHATRGLSQEAGALPFMLLDTRLVGAHARVVYREARRQLSRAVLGGVRWTHAAYRGKGDVYYLLKKDWRTGTWKSRPHPGRATASKCEIAREPQP